MEPGADATDFIKGYVEFRDKVWTEDPHYRGFLAALKELGGETDRGMALVATSFLDTLLGDILAAFLIKNDAARALLSGFNAPFGSFATRIAGCHALGLITDDEAAQCNILRRVRNKFAHEVEVSFSNDSVSGLCNNLSVPARDKEALPRQKFAIASLTILISMLNRAHQVAQKRLAVGAWNAGK